MRFKSFLMTGTGRSHPSGPYQTRPTRWLVSFRRAWVGLACAAASSLGIAAFAPSHAAGFDCSKASTLVESLICADPTLSALDDEVTAAWGDARRASANPNQLVEAQRAFIRQRGQCQNPRCIADITRQRTAELKAISASAVAPGAGQPAAATPRPTPATPQSGGGAFAGVMPSQPAAAAAGAVGGQQTTRDGKIVQTVLAEGMGSTIESAVQNAAENALKQVVGTFVDTNTQIERRTQISEGLRSETRNIRRDMREYSQGSIQGFEVLENRMDGGIHRVTAKVAVRVDDFKVYVKKLTEGETTVGRGLFAQLATEEKNKDSAADLVARHILEPALSGSIYRIKVLPPEKFDDPDGVFNIKVPLDYSIDPNYITNALKILEETASRKVVQDRNRQTCPYETNEVMRSLVVEASNIISFDQSPRGVSSSGTVTTYLFSGMRESIVNSGHLRNRGGNFHTVQFVLSSKTPLSMLVEIVNSEGTMLHSHAFAISGGQYEAAGNNRIYGPEEFKYDGRLIRTAPVAMHLNYPPTYLFAVPHYNEVGSKRCATSVRLSVGKVLPGAAIFMKLPLDMMRQASKIVVKLQ